MHIGVRYRKTGWPGWRFVTCLFLGYLVSPHISWGQEPELPPAAKRAVDFDKEIKPLFVRSCYRCHGSERQKGGLGLHRQNLAMAGGDSGRVIEPGKSAESRLVKFIAGIDDDGIMPPEGSGKPLSPGEIGLIRAWIDQGATWSIDKDHAQSVTSKHWAFQRPKVPAIPQVKQADWPRNAIDSFILAKLEQEGLHPSTEASRTTLIRRVYLDLIGLPPTPAEVDAFVKDSRLDAYEVLVDRLLASPHYGERWGRRWLDRARYADTNGYEKDRERSIWPYRDWVIKALNADMPFDQFTVEQIAGDLLPKASESQRIATGFHRNTMINEEGGIDVEEFRFTSLVDRVATTGTVWLGLTVQCAQCHTHKYDPITQREYYQLFAFLNNADEPEMNIDSAKIRSERAQVEAQIESLVSERESQFPIPQEGKNSWIAFRPLNATSSSGAVLSILPDESIQVEGLTPESDTYTVVVETKRSDIEAIRLEALTAPSLPSTGPGRTPHGNFVLTDLRVSASPKGKEEPSVPLSLQSPQADFSQVGYGIQGALDDDPHSGWAIDDGSGKLNKDRTATFAIGEKIPFSGGTRLVFTLDQKYGSKHVLGKFRLSAQYHSPAAKPAPLTDQEKRQRAIEEKLADWLKRTPAFHWTPLRPSGLTSKKHATLEVQDDLSVLATGDKPNNDVYEVDIETNQQRISGVRLEVLPDPSLPDDGPGRAPLFSVGDFILTDFSASLIDDANGGQPRPVLIESATQDYSEGGHPAALAIDAQPDTGWTVRGGTGQRHAAVFAFKEPVTPGRSGKLRLTLRQEGIHQMTIGRFRISITSDTGPVRASGVPAEIEAILVRPADQRTAEETKRLRDQYLAVAPELAKHNEKIEALRKSMPRFNTSMIMQERPAKFARSTFIHKRGEFLKPTEKVEADVPGVLPPLPASATKNRLTFANWLMDESNPLVARVVMNQFWQAFFGRGLVATVEDFGTRGEAPSHPELLDWLATEFPRQGWSTKTMHRLIVLSATYRQDSHVSPELLARDPKNILLSRGARFRVEAEVVRDIALSAAGLLTPKIGGPSVFPPQPDGVTTLAYGQTPWTASKGPDRFRRGLYTYIKRTAPYAAYSTMDAPTPETTCVRRERSNTPLQALTVLNDLVFVEASRALARRVLAEASPNLDDRLRYAVRICLSREPQPDELALLRRFHDHQLARFEHKELDAAKVMGVNPKSAGDSQTLPELAAWTTVARSLLNLDETITKE